MRTEDKYDSLFQYYGWHSGVDWLMLKAQARAESDFDPRAISPAGARGLTQFMPATWEWAIEMKWIPASADIFNPEHSIQAQAANMDWLLKQFKGDSSRALAAYNWGIGNLRNAMRKAPEQPRAKGQEPRAGMIGSKHSALGSKPSQGSWVEQLPEETQNYLKRISENYTSYKNESSSMARV